MLRGCVRLHSCFVGTRLRGQCLGEQVSDIEEERRDQVSFSSFSQQFVRNTSHSPQLFYIPFYAFNNWHQRAFFSSANARHARVLRWATNRVLECPVGSYRSIELIKNRILSAIYSLNLVLIQQPSLRHVHHRSVTVVFFFSNLAVNKITNLSTVIVIFYSFSSWKSFFCVINAHYVS